MHDSRELVFTAGEEDEDDDVLPLCGPCADGEHRACLKRNWDFDEYVSDGVDHIEGQDCRCPECNREN